MSHPDENLKQYASPDQWAAYEAHCLTGTTGKAARHLGKARTTVQQQLKLLNEKALRGGYVPPGYKIAKVSTTTNADGDIKSQSIQVKEKGAHDRDVMHVPNPRNIIKTSTYYGVDRSVTGQWVQEKPQDVEREKLWEIFAKELSATVERVDPMMLRDQFYNTDLLACYLVGDHHHGMLAWGEETGGDDYDLTISESILRDASTYLIKSVPACDTALITFLGDFFHYDGMVPVTPTSGNVLDADSRFPKMVRAGIRSMRHMITAGLEHHRNVHVIVEIGNHDLSSSIFLMECLNNIYENEPRVTIDVSPSHYHYYEFGNSLIGTHHGHGSKMEKLPSIMACDRPEAWGRTRHRYWWTGHIHSRTAHDFPGCSVESLRILAPPDAWAAQKGYRSIRDMKAIVIHKQHGEVARHTANPGMFRLEEKRAA
ncbi:hypothetical protein UFOVP1339_5 [uncultured Caudovirales phage]|uniref:Uncharacterized protein n=1 Tax=uncultured Caudovirales phage TaxID=2100421 RepID=A0A6J5RYT7_9CAUD|nr:hypothetical protein UFOVP1339_5 [uncultured Caudovirales phage]